MEELNYIQLITWVVISVIFLIIIRLLLRYIDDMNDSLREERN